MCAVIEGKVYKCTAAGLIVQKKYSHVSKCPQKIRIWRSVPKFRDGGRGAKEFGRIDLKFSEFIEAAKLGGVPRVFRDLTAVLLKATVLSRQDMTSFLAYLSQPHTRSFSTTPFPSLPPKTTPLIAYFNFLE